METRRLGSWKWDEHCGHVGGRFTLTRHDSFRKCHKYRSSVIMNTLSVPAPRNIVSEPYPKQRNLDPLLRERSSKRIRSPERTHDAVNDRIFTFFEANDVALAVSSSGDLLLHQGGSRVAEARVSLPASCLECKPRLIEHIVVDKVTQKAVIRWSPSDSGDGYAELHVSPASNSCGEWCGKLSQGFSLDFQIHSSAHESAEVTVQIGEAKWFGGGHFIRQMWPLNDAAIEVGPWYSFDNGPTGQNNLLGPHWYTSNGLLVAFDPDTPYLHVGFNAPSQENLSRKWGVGIQNATRELLPLTLKHGRIVRNGSDGLLRIQSRRSYEDSTVHHPLKYFSSSSSMSSIDCEAESCTMGDCLSVRVALCTSKNAAESVRMALSTLQPPGKLPDRSVLRSPIWTTWARYKTRVNQAKVLRYAEEIVCRGMQRSVMEIDDKWQTLYGDLTFDPKKFPDPVGMIDALHELGFKVTCWVHPFVEERSAAYKEGAPKGYFVSCDPSPEGDSFWSHARRFLDGGRPNGSSSSFSDDPDAAAPGFFAWWNSPPVAALDVTNPDAVDWFVGRLRDLQDATGLDGFKFDAGEPCFLPERPRTFVPMATPSEYTRLYVQRVAGAFAGGVSEVRTGHMTQDVALLCRMGDRFSTWDAGNGLRSIIPTLLTSGLMGYPFCLPDMIGGNGYFGKTPDTELLVRWAQVNALMPAMQFSIAPWDLSREAEKLVRSAMDIRQQMEGLLLELAEEAAETLMPICRPMWMLSPDDDHTYGVQDQFALGDDVIVAPVVHRGARRRDIYLTEGLWRDLHDGALFQGGQWLRGMPAPLEKLPIFVREGTSSVRF